MALQKPQRGDAQSADRNETHVLSLRELSQRVKDRARSTSSASRSGPATAAQSGGVGAANITPNLPSVIASTSTHRLQNSTFLGQSAASACSSSSSRNAGQPAPSTSTRTARTEHSVGVGGFGGGGGGGERNSHHCPLPPDESEDYYEKFAAFENQPPNKEQEYGNIMVGEASHEETYQNQPGEDEYMNYKSGDEEHVYASVRRLD